MQPVYVVYQLDGVEHYEVFTAKDGSFEEVKSMLDNALNYATALTKLNQAQNVELRWRITSEKRE